MTTGTLYIVATPIGNLADMTFRAVETLKAVDCIFAEDTRTSKKLLNHYGIETRMQSLHEHNEQQRIQQILKALEAGQQLALISDAGTPLISDPGFPVVRAVQQAGFKVSPIPGACAMAAALSVAGLPTDRFVFEGFLPAKSGTRQSRLEQLKAESRTLIFYESPRRIQACLQDMSQVFGHGRPAVLIKELTKTFETTVSGTVETLIEWLEEKPEHAKGEMVLLVQGAEQSSDLPPESLDTLKILLSSLSQSQAVSLAAKITGEKKNALYAEALKILK